MLYESPCEDIGDLLPFNPRILMKKMKTAIVIAGCARCAIDAMEVIHAKLIVTPAAISETIPARKGTRVFKAARAYGADTWRQRGGMMGGNGGSCRGVTSGNGIGVVPQAFCK